MEHLNMSLKAFSNIIVASGILARCSAKVDGIKHGGKSSGVEIDENGPLLGFNPFPLKDLEMKRHLKGKSNKSNKSDKQCDPKKEPFNLVVTNITTTGSKPTSKPMCVHQGPGFSIYPGLLIGLPAGTLFKSANECCKKNPAAVVIRDPDENFGYCFSLDQVCFEDKKICQKLPFYFYDNIEPVGKVCVRGCSVVERIFLDLGILPFTEREYNTKDECCDVIMLVVAMTTIHSQTYATVVPQPPVRPSCLSTLVKSSHSKQLSLKG